MVFFIFILIFHIMRLHSIHFHIPLYTPTPSESALPCCPDVVHLMRGRGSSSSYGLRVRSPTCLRWAEEEGIFPPPLSPHDRQVEGTASHSHNLSAGSPTPPPMGLTLLFCPGEVHSPECCSWWGAGTALPLFKWSLEKLMEIGELREY